MSTEKADIRSEVMKYKKIFLNTKNTRYISSYLESYLGYCNQTLSKLNDAFRKDEQLYKLVGTFGLFKNYKVILERGKNELIDKMGNYLDENGIKLGYGEGNIYLYFDPIYISEEFSSVLPKIAIEYFSLESIDIAEGFEEDAGLTVPWDTIRTKILRYEKYCNKIGTDYPYIIKIVRNKILLYLGVYLKGLPNTSIDEQIKEAKSSYERYLEEDKESIYFEIIKNYYNDLKRNRFEFIYKQHMKHGHYYESPMIFDVYHNEISIYEVADRYLNEIKKNL